MGTFGKIVKKGLKGIAFVTVFLILWILVNQVMIFKQEDGTLPARNFYDLPADTVDVLVLGSSHAGVNIRSRTLWDEYGIACYRLWGSIQSGIRIVSGTGEEYHRLADVHE